VPYRSGRLTVDLLTEAVHSLDIIMYRFRSQKNISMSLATVDWTVSLYRSATAEFP